MSRVLLIALLGLAGCATGWGRPVGPNGERFQHGIYVLAEVDKVKCENVRVLGTHLPRRQCRTVEMRERLRLASQRKLENMHEKGLAR